MKLNVGSQKYRISNLIVKYAFLNQLTFQILKLLYIILDTDKRERRDKRSSLDRGGELWRVRVMVVTDESMMWHYDNEEHVLTVYIETLMAEVASIFRYDMLIL